MSDWFSSLATQAMKMADDFADSLVAQANEAQEQIQREQAKLREEDELKKVTLSTNTQLPWETQDEALQILSDALMDSILKLSLNERNFTSAPANADEIHFVFSDFIATALHLLQLDSNLAHVHSKVSPKMDEEVFWRNYYGRVIYLRAACGIDGSDAQEHYTNKWKVGDIVFEPDYLQAKSSASKLASGEKRSPSKGSNSRSSSSSNLAKSGAAGEAAVDNSDLLDDLDELDELDFGTSGAAGRTGGDEAEGAAGDDEEEDEEVDLGDLDLADLDDELDLLRELKEMEEEEDEEVESSGQRNKQIGDGSSSGKSNKGHEVGELGSYQDVTKSDCTSSTSNAELEAQIAAELANISDDED